MKKKIALLSQFGKPIRGLSPYSDSLFAELNKQKNICISQVDYKSPFPSFLHPAKSESLKQVGDLSWWNPFSWLRLAKSDFDVVHIQHWLSPMSFYLLPVTWLSRRNGKKVVVTVHNPEAHEHAFGFRIIETLFYKYADAIIVHTENSANSLRTRTNNKTPVSVIPLGIEFQRQLPLADKYDALDKLGLDKKFNYVLIFGNLRGYKGIGLLLRAWRVVVLEHPDVKLIIGGRLWTGQDFFSRIGATISGTRSQSLALAGELDALVKQEKILYFPGFLPDEMIDSLVRVSEFCVFPYEKFESQSAAACRAVGLGSPVLVSNVGGLPDVAIDESWIVEPRNLDGLISTLNLKIMASKKGLERVDFSEKFHFMSTSAVAKETAGLYLSLFRKQESNPAANHL